MKRRRRDWTPWMARDRAGVAGGVFVRGRYSAFSRRLLRRSPTQPSKSLQNLFSYSPAHVPPHLPIP